MFNDYNGPNIFDLDGTAIIPTNLVVDNQGLAIMGGGLALQAKLLYPELPKRIGEHILHFEKQGCREEIGHFNFKGKSIVHFPTKYHYKDPSDLELIKKSATSLKEVCDLSLQMGLNFRTKLIPRVGCGLGGLDWSVVKPELETIFAEHLNSGLIKFVDP